MGKVNTSSSGLTENDNKLVIISTIVTMSAKHSLQDMACDDQQTDDLDTESMSTSGVKKKRKQVLAEDVYVQHIESIIERDYYPDLPQMRRQLQSYEDNHLMSERRFAVDRPLNPSHSPTTFETPVHTSSSQDITTDGIGSDKQLMNELNDGEDDEPKNVSLDKFLNRFTSEDNASFEQIQEQEMRRHRQKYEWLYKDVSKHNDSVNKLLELPSIERQAIDDKANCSASVVTWNYKNQNSVMYNPSALAITDNQKLAYSEGPSVDHSNTRFERLPFNERINQKTIAMAAQLNHRQKEGKIGIDGKELVTRDTPQINGFKFVASTPTPNPHLLSESPLMTWGEIEGTPFSLSGSETPLHPTLTPGASHFKIPDLPQREKIGLSLAARNTQQNKDKKRSAIERVRSSLRGSSPAFCSSKTPLERLNSMSPAAQKLATNKLGVHRNADHSLMASYSPARARVRTPLRTPGSDSSSSRLTPFDSPVTPKLSEKVIQKDINSRISEFSIKKNRNRAKDFF